MSNLREIYPEEKMKLQYLVRSIEQTIPIQEWDFRLNAKFIARLRPNMILPAGDGRYPTVIYDSEYCRVMFSLARNIKGDELIVAYGRSHASDDEQLMKWNGEDCYCWHWNVYDLILKFLDGLSPQEAVISRGKLPRGLEGFLALGLQDTLEDVEFTLRYHSEIWKFYGKSLFELFDMRKPELWEEYTLFVREYYDRHHRSRAIIPPLDKIC